MVDRGKEGDYRKERNSLKRPKLAQSRSVDDESWILTLDERRSCEEMREQWSSRP